MRFVLFGTGALLAIGMVWYLFYRTPPISTVDPHTLKAIYLVNGTGILSKSELKVHPEIAVTGSFSRFKQYAKQKVALWIDMNAVDLVDIDWLNTEPEKNYPIALVGYNDTLYSFREMLRINGFFGPIILHWDKKTLIPGFSVIKLQKTSEGWWAATYLKGYKKTPHVEEILSITNLLLEDKPEPTPTIFVHAPTPTVNPVFY